MPGICEPSVGLAADDLDRRILLLEKARHAHDGAGGAHAGDEMRDLAAGIAPDFRAGAFVVRQRIVRIGELVENDRPCPRRASFRRRRAPSPCRRPCGVSTNSRAERRHGLPAFDRKVFRHHQHHAVAHHRRRHRQRDAGVAAGRLDQRVAGLDLAALLGAPDHRQRRPVLDRSRRIVALELGQQRVAGIARACA